MRKRVCAPMHGNGEYTICGDAFDAHSSGDCPEEINLGDPGDLVTCEKCREAIAYYKTFKRNRIPKD